MEVGWCAGWFTGDMKTTNVHHEVEAALAVTGNPYQSTLSVIKLGVDVHQGSYTVVAQEDHATPRPAQRFLPAAFVPWVGRLVARGHRICAVYEACGFGFGLQRALAALGVECHVVAPCRLDERRERVKTDGRDASALCQRLSRYVDGNRRELAVIRVPSEEEERLRAEHRQRETLVRARTRLAAQGRALIVNHSGDADRPAHIPARWWRAAGWKALAKVLPEWLCERLAVLRPVLAILDTQIAALTGALEDAAPPGLPAGQGKMTAVVLGREICDWHRFANRRQVSSYTGLCPGEYSSGGKRTTGSVTKHGNPRLRAALVELAWRMVRFQPAYPPVAKRLLVLGKGAHATGAQRKKAIVAVARQLAVDLWRLHTARCTPAQLGLHVPGAEPAPAPEEVVHSGGTVPPPAPEATP
jgi:transposase